MPNPANGDIRTELKISMSLPNPVTCILYLEFDNFVLIDKFRSIIRFLIMTDTMQACTLKNVNHLTPNDHFSGRTAPLTSRCCILLFIQQIYVLNILNMLHTLCFFSSSKCRLFHNATFFGSCIIHILYTGCAQI